MYVATISTSPALRRLDVILIYIYVQRYLRAFLARVENYDEVIPEGERALHERKASLTPDPARRRELKIKQYQKEKDLRARIEV